MPHSFSNGSDLSGSGATKAVSGIILFVTVVSWSQVVQFLRGRGKSGLDFLPSVSKTGIAF
jgi:hypothetical protein